jgi:hypothetical protein
VPTWTILVLIAALTEDSFVAADVVHLNSPITEAQIREERSVYPGRAMMFHGYLGSAGQPYHNPVTLHHGYDKHNGRSYNPQQTMTAFAAGDTVSAGSSYYGGGGGLPCRNCNGANKHANGNGYSNGNGNANSNGNGHPINGNGFHQHTVPSQTPAINGNGQQKPKGEEEVGYPNGNGNGSDNGGYLGEQPAAEETLPPAAPTRPTATEAPKKGTA